MKNENIFFAIRGKSDRRRIRDSKKQKEKSFIELYKKERKLNLLYRNLGIEELENPYQKGFKRSFVLREDIAKTKKAEFYLELLKHINTTQKSLRKDFKKKKRKNRKRIYTESEQHLKRLDTYEFCKLPDTFKPHFMKVESYSLKYKRVEIKYIFIESWRYVLKVTPNMVKHRKRLDATLVSEIKQIENYIDRNYLRPVIDKVRSKNHQCKNWNIKPKEKQIPVFKILKQENEQH